MRMERPRELQRRRTPSLLRICAAQGKGKLAEPAAARLRLRPASADAVPGRGVMGARRVQSGACALWGVRRRSGVMPRLRSAVFVYSGCAAALAPGEDGGVLAGTEVIPPGGEAQAGEPRGPAAHRSQPRDQPGPGEAQ